MFTKGLIKYQMGISNLAAAIREMDASSIQWKY